MRACVRFLVNPVLLIETFEEAIHRDRRALPEVNSNLCASGPEIRGSEIVLGSHVQAACQVRVHGRVD